MQCRAVRTRDLPSNIVLSRRLVTMPATRGPGRPAHEGPLTRSFADGTAQKMGEFSGEREKLQLGTNFQATGSLRNWTRESDWRRVSDSAQLPGEVLVEFQHGGWRGYSQGRLDSPGFDGHHTKRCW
jgi:hypothetical protein